MEAPNPFTERGIIRDPKLFFGRKHELKQTFERLAAMQSVSIFGERRIGKSSLLVMIAGFTVYYAAVLCVRVRAEIISRERNARWLREELAL